MVDGGGEPQAAGEGRDLARRIDPGGVQVRGDWKWQKKLVLHVQRSRTLKHVCAVSSYKMHISVGYPSGRVERHEYLPPVLRYVWNLYLHTEHPCPIKPPHHVGLHRRLLEAGCSELLGGSHLHAAPDVL